MPIRFLTLDSKSGPLDQLEDVTSGLRLIVSRLGAEPVSLTLRDEGGERHGFLWRDGDVEKPASGWGNHATVMGYFVHRLWQQESIYDGHPIRGGIHGLSESSLFRPERRHGRRVP